MTTLGVGWLARRKCGQPVQVWGALRWAHMWVETWKRGLENAAGATGTVGVNTELAR